MKKLAPIILFVYERPDHTRKMIEALAKNNLAKESEVYIFSDNAKKSKDNEKVKEVREYINTIPEKSYFKKVTIIESKENKGLAKSVIDGVTEIINEKEKVIVVEDDLITSKFFLEYMNNALDFYNKDEKIWSISGYNLPIEIANDYEYDIYLGYRGCSWGWATWKDRWNTVDWEVKDYKKFKHSYRKRKIINRGGPDMAQMLDAQMKGLCDSWAIRWCYEQSKQNKYTVYPVKSLIQNCGLDGTGTHSGINSAFDVKLNQTLPTLNSELVINKKISKNLYNKFDYGVKQKIIEMLTILGLEKTIGTLRRKR